MLAEKIPAMSTFFFAKREWPRPKPVAAVLSGRSRGDKRQPSTMLFFFSFSFCITFGLKLAHGIKNEIVVKILSKGECHL